MSTIKCKNQLGELRDVSSEKFKFRPTAYGLVVDKGRILVMKNRFTGKFWFPGGGLNIHETLEEGLKREIKEEIAIDVKIGDQLFMEETFFYYEPDDEGYHMFLFFYHCTPSTTPEKLVGDSPDPDLHEAEWIPVQDITEDRINDLSGSGNIARQVCQTLKRLI